MNFQKAVDIVMQMEGGLVRHPNDPGGLTKFGISQRSYPALDIANLTASDAVGIYRRDYWDKMRCEELPRGLNLLVFDAAVNQGIGAATALLQQCAGVATDGVIGPKTLEAAKTVRLSRYASARNKRYQKNLNAPTFFDGWSNRLMDVFELAVKDAA